AIFLESDVSRGAANAECRARTIPERHPRDASGLRAPGPIDRGVRYVRVSSHLERRVRADDAEGLDVLVRATGVTDRYRVGRAKSGGGARSPPGPERP